MKYIVKGTNKIFINTSGFGLNPSITVLIYSNMTDETKTFTPKIIDSNDRFFSFMIELVDIDDENLSNNKIYLIPGQHRLYVKSSNITYVDILYVDGDVLKDDKKYINNKVSRVYKKQ